MITISQDERSQFHEFRLLFGVCFFLPSKIGFLSFSSGMNLFVGGTTFPDPSVQEAYFNVLVAAPVDVTVLAGGMMSLCFFLVLLTFISMQSHGPWLCSFREQCCSSPLCRLQLCGCGEDRLTARFGNFFFCDCFTSHFRLFAQVHLSS